MTGLMIVLVGVVFGLIFLSRRATDEAFEHSRAAAELDLAPPAAPIPAPERAAYRELCRGVLQDAVTLRLSLDEVAAGLGEDDLDVPARGLEEALEVAEETAERLATFTAHHRAEGEAGEWLSHAIEQLESVLSLGEHIDQLLARDKRFVPAGLERAGDALDMMVLAGADFADRMLDEQPLALLKDALDAAGQARFKAMRERGLAQQ